MRLIDADSLLKRICETKCGRTPQTCGHKEKRVENCFICRQIEKEVASENRAE